MVSRESVKISMTWASLNDLEVNCLCIHHSAEEELDKIDLVSHVALPRKGHQQTVFHIYAYLKKGQNSRLTLDPHYPEIDMRVFHQADWADIYGDVKEVIPDNAPEPRGKPIILRAFMDSGHANDKVRRRSQTGFCFFINISCIIWYTNNR